MSREWAGHRYWDLTLPDPCGNDQQGCQSEIYTEALNQGVCPELPGISCRLSAEGLGRDLRRGFCGAGPGSRVLIASMTLSSSQQPLQHSRLQATMGTDGLSARRTGLQTCNEGSMAGEPLRPCWANSWLLSQGGRRQAEGPCLWLGHFPLGLRTCGIKPQWLSSLTSFLGPEGGQSVRDPSGRNKRGLTHLLLWGGADAYPNPLWRLGRSFLRLRADTFHQHSLTAGEKWKTNVFLISNQIPESKAENHKKEKFRYQ